MESWLVTCEAQGHVAPVCESTFGGVWAVGVSVRDLVFARPQAVAHTGALDAQSWLAEVGLNPKPCSYNGYKDLNR